MVKLPKKKKVPNNFKLVYLEDIIPEYSSEYSIASIYRMLPCAVDGLKPIQRKILWSMYKGKIYGHKDKCSSIVGDVAKYLTTGDDSVYPALTKLGQSFRNTHLPIEIQGNQGYITDNKEPAAKRYTEAEISQYGLDMYFDEDIEFTKYIKNYNGTLQEPLILPTLLPMALICGNKGTATGYTNHILPHDMKSIAKCYIRYLETLNGKHSIKTFDKFLEKNIKLGIPNKSKSFSPLRYWGGLYLINGVIREKMIVLVPFDIGVVYILQMIIYFKLMGFSPLRYWGGLYHC